MSKKESTFLNMTVSLLLITLISGFALGFVNDLTIEPKAKAKLEKKINAIKQVLPEFNNNPVKDLKKVKLETATDSIEVYPAYNNEEFVGAAVTGFSEKGFSGLVKIMVGFKPDGSIRNIAVLEQKETPGLGTKMKDESFLQQFRNKNPNTFNIMVKKDGGEVDALTGATISSRAFTEAAHMAYNVFLENKDAFKPSK
ncbi:RnfABCDGE type electron transport complex subunit G [Flavobacteriaceae bacterium GSB9]|nr:RnfABCDGE type electron transport complex subunit G [Flavobacteriaceae bacterium GSB9]